MRAGAHTRNHELLFILAPLLGEQVYVPGHTDGEQQHVHAQRGKDENIAVDARTCAKRIKVSNTLEPQIRRAKDEVWHASARDNVRELILETYAQCWPIARTCSL